MMSNQNSKSFTLIELLIVLAIIAILVTVLILTINPGAIFSRARDTKRINDLKNIEKIMDAIYATEYTFNELNYASSNVVYISLPDSSSTCGSWLSELPSLPSGWSYHCSATPTNIDGTGWIPIPFSNFPILNISQLPIDPLNKPPYYYSFVVGGSYAVYAQLEDPKNQASKNDGDNYPHLYSAGTNKRLIDQAQGLVGYWPFDEGSGNIAKDYSGNGNNGTLVNGPTWTTGKVGGALNFDGVDDYVRFSDDFLPLGNNPHTIIEWINPAKICSDCMTMFHYGQCATNQLRLLFFRSNSIAGAFCGNDFTSGLIPSTNTWQFVVWRWDNSTGKETIFLDLQKRERTTSGVNTPNLTSGYIGGVHANWYWQGLIDEVRVYNRALSDSEIKALYDATK